MPYEGSGNDKYVCKACGEVLWIEAKHFPGRDRDQAVCPSCGAFVVSWNGSRAYEVYRLADWQRMMRMLHPELGDG